MHEVSIYPLGSQITFAKYEGKRLSVDVERDLSIVKDMLLECFSEVLSISSQDNERSKVLQRRFEYILDQFSDKVDDMRNVTNQLIELQNIS